MRSRALLRATSALLAVAGVAAAAAALTVIWGASAEGGLAPATPPPRMEIHAAHGASYLPALAGRRPLFILALGSDARPGERVDRMRADSIHLIGVNPARTRATILGFPRDSYVDVPGLGRAKMNEGMVVGGPRTMVATVERLTGIRIDFWLLTSFRDFTHMVNAIDGVTLEVRYPMFDSFSGTRFRPGRRHLDGGEALAFARDRHSAPGGDFGRSQNQGRLMVAALAKLRTVARERPGALFSWMSALWRNVSTDLPPNALLDLALTAARVDPRNVRNVVLPGSPGSAGGASVVYVSGGAWRIFADMRRDGVLG